MSAQVTEAHLKLCQQLNARWTSYEDGAQLIADSEAKAVEAERARLYGIGRKKGEQPVSSDMDIGHRCLSGDKWPQPVDPIAECARLGRELADSIAERDQLRAECNNLRADLDAIKAIRNEETARAERAEASLHALRLICGTTDADKFSTWVDRANARADEAEHDCRVLISRLNVAEAELADIRALANRRNKRDHSQDTTHQLVAALDQALDIAQAELAAERARVDQLILTHPLYDSRDQLDAAMREGGK